MEVSLQDIGSGGWGSISENSSGGVGDVGAGVGAGLGVFDATGSGFPDTGFGGIQPTIPSGITSGPTTSGGGWSDALANLGVNLLSGVASVGLGALGTKAGVGYVNPNSLTQRPGSVRNGYIPTAVGAATNGLFWAGALVIGGVIFFALLRRRGA